MKTLLFISAFLFFGCGNKAARCVESRMTKTLAYEGMTFEQAKEICGFKK